MNPGVQPFHPQSQRTGSTATIFQKGVNQQVNSLNTGSISEQARIVGTGEGAGAAEAAKHSTTTNLGETRQHVKDAAGKLPESCKKAAHNSHVATLSSTFETLSNREKRTPKSLIQWIQKLLGRFNEQGGFILRPDKVEEFKDELNGLDYLQFFKNEGEKEELFGLLGQVENLSGVPGDLKQLIKDVKVKLSNFSEVRDAPTAIEILSLFKGDDLQQGFANLNTGKQMNILSLAGESQAARFLNKMEPQNLSVFFKKMSNAEVAGFLNKMEPAKIAELLNKKDFNEAVGVLDNMKSSKVAEFLDKKDFNEAVKFLEKIDPRKAVQFLNTKETGQIASFLNKKQPEQIADYLCYMKPIKVREFFMGKGADEINGLLGQIDHAYAAKLLSNMESEKAQEFLNTKTPSEIAEFINHMYDKRGSRENTQKAAAIIANFSEEKIGGILLQVGTPKLSAAILRAIVLKQPDKAEKVIFNIANSMITDKNNAVKYLAAAGTLHYLQKAAAPDELSGIIRANFEQSQAEDVLKEISDFEKFAR